MKIKISTSERFILFSFFIILILLGAGLLSIPAAWAGEGRLGFIDALFTSVSAVCVTGLITVDTTEFTKFGQIVILFLIQTGGLGLISFSTIYLTMPRRKKSFKNISIIRKYSIDFIEYKENHIIRNIVLTTFGIEIICALILMPMFTKEGHPGFFNALFHSISAFCNAGFSLNSDSLMQFQGSGGILAVIMFLIIVGGIGFVVIQDIVRRVFRRSKHLSLHSKIVMWTTLFLIVTGTISYYFLERNHALAGMSGGKAFLNALFQSVTTRTAGFNAIDQAALSDGSKLITLPFMFIGGSPGSIAGGVKVTTFAIVLISVIKGFDRKGQIKLGKRKLAHSTITNAHIFIVKGMLLVFAAIILLGIVEGGSGFSFIELVFEVFSALGTVGLSLGVTGGLSVAGKVIIIITMFAGRVGLISMAIPIFKSYVEKYVEYPVEEVLIG